MRLIVSMGLVVDVDDSLCCRTLAIAVSVVVMKSSVSDARNEVGCIIKVVHVLCDVAFQCRLNEFSRCAI